jgi:hypothetical protein
VLSSKYDEKVGVTVDPKLGQGQHDDNKPSTKQPPSFSSLQARPTASKTDKAECPVHEQNSDCSLVEYQSQIRPIPRSVCAGVDWRQLGLQPKAESTSQPKNCRSSDLPVVDYLPIASSVVHGKNGDV